MPDQISGNSKPMNDFLTILENNADIIDTAFGIPVVKTEQFNGKIDPNKEVVVSALSFAGDYCGDLVIVLEKSRTDALAAELMDIFGIFGVSVDNHEIFGEVLNIHAGNLATAMSKSGLTASISTPIEDLSVFPIGDVDKSLVFELEAGTRVRYCYFNKAKN